MNSTTLLQQSAAGLFSDLQRLLTPEELTVFAESYDKVAAKGGTEESPVHREVGASFNPRPARVVKIILADGNSKCLSTFLLAIWSCIDRKAFGSDNHPHLSQQLVLALGRILSPRCEQISSEQEVDVALALALDQIRHLHMTSLNRDEKANVLARAQLLADHANALFSGKKLAGKLHYAVQQQRRIIESD